MYVIRGIMEVVQYLNFVLLSFLLDFFWFGALGNVGSIGAVIDGLPFAMAPRYLALVVSVLNVFLKVCLLL